MGERRSLSQGTMRHALSERGDDLYETPECAVRALLRHASLPARVWEPCAGPGAIVRVLRDAGREVVATELVDRGERNCPGCAVGVDFLLEQERRADVIVTNPPFKLADPFIRHGLALGCTVVALLRLVALEGERRSDIIDGHLRSVLMGRERLPMMHRDGWSGPKHSNSGAPFAWFEFVPHRLSGGPVQLTRISWRTP